MSCHNPAAFTGERARIFNELSTATKYKKSSGIPCFFKIGSKMGK